MDTKILTIFLPTSLICKIYGQNWRCHKFGPAPLMTKASLLPQALTPTYKNLSPSAQEISSGEMSDVTKKKWQLVKPVAAPRGDSSYGFKLEYYIRSLPEEPHLAWVFVTFSDFRHLSWAYFLCYWDEILIFWCQTLRELTGFGHL